MRKDAEKIESSDAEKKQRQRQKIFFLIEDNLKTYINMVYNRIGHLKKVSKPEQDYVRHRVNKIGSEIDKKGVLKKHLRELITILNKYWPDWRDIYYE